MNDEPKRTGLSGEVQAAIVAGTFGLLTLMLTQWDKMPWNGGGGSEQNVAANASAAQGAPPVQTNAQAPDGEAADTPAEDDRAERETPRYGGYANAPGSQNAPGLLRLYSRAVARLEVDGSPRCTAFLVSDDLALTASYCVPEEGGAIALRFDESSPPAPARLVESSGLVAMGGGIPDRLSYALLKVDGNPGAQRGWLPLTSALPAAGGSLRVIGGAIQRTVAPCTTGALHEAVFRNDCDPGDGGGGAPILAADASRVVGVYAYRDRGTGDRFAVRADRLLERSERLARLAAE